MDEARHLTFVFRPPSLAPFPKGCLMTEPITLSCRNLWKIFGPHPARAKEMAEAGTSKAALLAESDHVLAVRDVSFEVRRGEFFVVMGLSGSGKSTLVRCLSRLIEPTSGEIEIDGENLTAMNERQLREIRRHKVSMVFQHFGLFPPPSCCGQRGLWAGGARHCQSRPPRNCASCPGDGGAGGLGRLLSPGTQRRHATARRAGACPGCGSIDPAL